MFTLRYYQHEAIAAVRREWEKVQSTAIVAATGAGKTEIYLSLAVEEPGRVLVIVHRDYLIEQPIKRLAQHGFTDVGIEKAELKSELGLSRAKIVFASIQSISRGERLSRFDPFDFGTVIVDEGHRGVGTTYRKVLEKFRSNPRLRVLILTATPKRKDGVSLGNICDSVAYVYGPKQAANDGWLAPLRFFRREVQGLDFSRVKLKGNDLDQEEVEKLLLQEEPLHRVCASLAEDRGSTIVFCPGVNIARAYCTLMNSRYRKDRSAVLWADSPDDERELVGKQLSNGDIDYIFNVDLFTEGYDVPDLMRVVWAAPTASLVRFTQGTGRVFRPHSSLRHQLTGDRAETEARRLLITQSPKPFGSVVTYYPQNCRHQLCEPNDILGGEDLPSTVRGYAKQIQEQTASQSGGSDPEEDVETAKTFIQLRALLDQRRQRIKAKAQTSDHEYDGFGGSRGRATGHNTAPERQAVKSVSSDWPDGKAVSAAMLTWLSHNGIPNARSLGLTAWRAFTIRRLIEAGVNAQKALSYGKKQALAVLATYQTEAEI